NMSHSNQFKVKPFKPYLEEVRIVEDCNVILVFCPIVSRAGTDIDAALNKLNTCSASKPAILMVFHYTFDPDKIVPDSSRFINRGNTLTVDCLFVEDVGLLTCNRNEEALAKIVQCFKYQVLSPCFCCFALTVILPVPQLLHRHAKSKLLVLLKFCIILKGLYIFPD
uniref:Uncharacterized protein n=1 Tax=Cyprinus carpio TaxID=7962 RepID=A0A8C1UNF5_CYPCA